MGIRYRHIAVLSMTLLCAQTSLAADPNANSENTLESYNKAMYKFNHQVDITLFEPAAQIYKNIVPPFIRTGITHFFDNIAEIPTIINGTLQGKIGQATSDTGRLLVNSTVGIGGLFDVATPIGLEQHQEDFGLTLAAWGWEDSSYFVIPILGPSTVRDAIGFIPNSFMTVWPYAAYFYPAYTYSAFALNMIDKRANALKTDALLDTASIDDYITIRDAYLQHRNYQIQGEQTTLDTTTDPNTDDLYVPENDL